MLAPCAHKHAQTTINRIHRLMKRRHEAPHALTATAFDTPSAHDTQLLHNMQKAARPREPAAPSSVKRRQKFGSDVRREIPHSTAGRLPATDVPRDTGVFNAWLRGLQATEWASSKALVFCLIANLLGLGCYLFFRSRLWTNMPEGELYANDGPSAISWFVTSFPFLLVGVLVNIAMFVIAIRHLVLGKGGRLLGAWAAMVGAWVLAEVFVQSHLVG